MKHAATIPEGLHAMNPYLFVEDPARMIRFVQEAFGGEEKSRPTRSESGEIANIMLQVGDATLMLSQGNAQLMTKGAGIYLYVSDVDEVHEKALAVGATEMFPAADMPYGDRQSGVVDPSGNYWWISRRMVNEPYAKNDSI